MSLSFSPWDFLDYNTTAKSMQRRPSLSISVGFLGLGCGFKVIIPFFGIVWMILPHPLNTSPLPPSSLPVWKLSFIIDCSLQKKLIFFSKICFGLLPPSPLKFRLDVICYQTSFSSPPIATFIHNSFLLLSWHIWHQNVTSS